VQAILRAAGVPYSINPRLVRGLDYYNLTVFEFITESLGAQGTICGGGRYDYLIEQIGGKPAPAVGWAMGVERVLELLARRACTTAARARRLRHPARRGQRAAAMPCLQALRACGVAVQMHAGGEAGLGSMKSQFKKADASGARFASFSAPTKSPPARSPSRPCATAPARRRASRWPSRPPGPTLKSPFDPILTTAHGQTPRPRRTGTARPAAPLLEHLGQPHHLGADRRAGRLRGLERLELLAAPPGAQAAALYELERSADAGDVPHLERVLGDIKDRFGHRLRRAGRPAGGQGAR
jgi:hypothetical protein